MKNNRLTVLLIILFILVVFGFALVKCMLRNRQLRESVPFLIPGERVSYFNLVSIDEKEDDIASLNGTGVNFIFIFSRPCIPCNSKNIIYWEKIASILKKDGVICRGVVLDNISNAYEFRKESRLAFPVYVPANLEQFIEKFRLKLKLSQTILCRGDHVKYAAIGELDGEEAVKIIKRARDLAGRHKKE